MAQAKTKIVAGVMSGTSADGVDVALVRISNGAPVPKLKLIGHSGFRYPKALRGNILRAMEGEAMTAAEFSHLNWALGSFYADCVAKACATFSVCTSEQAKSARGPRLELIGLHGQTLFHETANATWQTGEAAVIRERIGVPVVNDFRSADIAAGGQGAPLVPMLDYCLLRSAKVNRVLLNLGGIANVTAIPAAGEMRDVLAFDTGPANMVIDALMWDCFGKSHDAGGKTAAKGTVLTGVIATLMLEGYFNAAPPKSCGREQFGALFAAKFKALCKAEGCSDADAVATATEFTAATVLDAYVRFCWAHLGLRAPAARATELIVAGGGVKNRVLMRSLSAIFGALGVTVKTSEEVGLAAQAKEAVAFALLGWLSLHGRPGNLPSATGAAGPRVLGKVTC